MMVRVKPTVWNLDGPRRVILDEYGNQIDTFWGWHLYGALLECVNNYSRPKGIPVFTDESFWDSFFALSDEWKDDQRCDSSQILHVIDTVDNQAVIIAMPRARKKTCQPLEKLWVPSGWGVHASNKVSSNSTSVRLPTVSEFKKHIRGHQIITRYLNGEEAWSRE